MGNTLFGWSTNATKILNKSISKFNTANSANVNLVYKLRKPTTNVLLNCQPVANGFNHSPITKL